MFDYSQFIQRNIGFVTESQQETLRKSVVLVIGVGGMGGAALACLARSGIGSFLITDIDTFEVSNLNRQIFSKVSVLGLDKAEIARKEILEINPDIDCELIKGDWTKNLGGLLQRADIVLNGCDDVRATIRLMREAKKMNKTVVDAYASTLPSVYVVRPEAPRPEEFMAYPTTGREPEDLTDLEVKACSAQETEYVMTHSSTAKHVVLSAAAEMITGKRKRISFAPMVWTTGTLMAYEVIKNLLDLPQQADHRGYFYNPYQMKVEKPLVAPMSWVKRRLVRYHLRQLTAESGPAR